jgi:hypothetical protein
MSIQASKKARETKRQAVAAGLPRGFSHPSHKAGVRRWERKYRHRVYVVAGPGRIQWRFADEI